MDMPNFIDLMGQRFSRLIVLSQDTKTRRNRVAWLCQCDCGKQATVTAYNLRGGNTKSCGCLVIDIGAQRLTKHGEYGTRLYRIWRGMHRRCYDPKRLEFFRYGGRGIQVCKQWFKIENFISDMGDPPSSKHSIDRIDNDGPYSPENCRWATAKEQSLNSRQPINVTLRGQTLNISEWARRIGIGEASMHARLKEGWPIELALTTPRVHRSRSPMRFLNSDNSPGIS